ncbi:Amino acid permease 1 [Linum grandiflorum]
MCPVNGVGEVAAAAASDHQMEQFSNDAVLHPAEEVDDDGKPKRTGTVWTASAHIITAIIGSGVLSLAWGIAQLGWIAGPATLLIFSSITYYTSRLLADCYRHHSTGKRNYTYMEAVNAYLGQRMEFACGVVQCVMLCGATIGYAITASISMLAIRKSECLHRNKVHDGNLTCKFSTNPYLIGMGIVEVVVSQIPNFHKLAWLSILAAIMSFLYASIGLGLAISRVASGDGETSVRMTGVEGSNGMDKVWRMFTAFGDMAFACSYSAILIEIQDTVRSSSSSSSSEKKVMKKANGIAVTVSTVFYLLCGCFGYAAFGDGAPGNMLSASGFDEPLWLIDLANVCIIVHLVGAFQVTAQPVFTRVEAWASRKWPDSEFVNREYPVKLVNFNLNPMRLVGRTGLVAAATVVAMAVPFFNDILALLGAISYWPLTVYFPVEMHIAQSNMIRKSSGREDYSAGRKWVVLQLLNVLCLVVAIAAACGAIHGLSASLLAYKPFMFTQ